MPVRVASAMRSFGRACRQAMSAAGWWALKDNTFTSTQPPAAAGRVWACDRLVVDACISSGPQGMQAHLCITPGTANSGETLVSLRSRAQTWGSLAGTVRARVADLSAARQATGQPTHVLLLPDLEWVSCTGPLFAGRPASG